jgi:hypothetical protein
MFSAGSEAGNRKERNEKWKNYIFIEALYYTKSL